MQKSYPVIMGYCSRGLLRKLTVVCHPIGLKAYDHNVKWQHLTVSVLAVCIM